MTPTQQRERTHTVDHSHSHSHTPSPSTNIPRARWSDLYRDTLAGPAAPDGVRIRASLLPESVWGSNVRGLVTQSIWNKLRIPVCEAAGNRCQICGHRPTTRRPDCHEKWSFTPATTPGTPGVQKLEALLALCAACHLVQHTGLARIRGEQDSVLDHLMRLNGWSAEQAWADVVRASNLGGHLWDLAWDLDLSLLRGQLQIPDYPDLLIPHAARAGLGNSYTPTAQRRTRST
ncbi:hypothetical protein [Streptacidiphilus sp. EB129]|uniref:hypothetical protein n=1 Tax=Streptacidiphilus sp. EB129 TaxID=3156262 RepID=UPI003513DD02